METHQLLMVIFASIPALGVIIGAIVYIVRKNDKVTNTPRLVENNTERIIKIEERLDDPENGLSEMNRQMKAAWKIIDSMKRGFDDLHRGNSLILKVLSRMSKKDGHEDIAEFIESHTVLVARPNEEVA